MFLDLTRKIEQVVSRRRIEKELNIRNILLATQQETTIDGILVADIFCECAGCDVMLAGSGAIRSKELGPAVTLGDFKACFPFDDAIKWYIVTGRRQLRRIFSHIMQPENRTGEGECYQVNAEVRAVYNDIAKALDSLAVNGNAVQDDGRYTLGLTGYHADNCAKNLDISPEELGALSGAKVMAMSCVSVLDEYFRAHPNISAAVEGRLIFRAP